MITDQIDHRLEILREELSRLRQQVQVASRLLQWFERAPDADQAELERMALEARNWLAVVCGALEEESQGSW
jgi:hypothetical protein